ncbi:MAG: hypothetical protein L0Y72_07480 [Gemmataceae bacterium]|nr:hypothetical protein [Gemmataceae bacterium]MCI0738869.1 hypothetical protein [Gemmataceae bacterium]
MRSTLLIAGLFLGMICMVGCGGGDKTAKIPTSTIDVPKDGPKAAGAPVGGGENKKVVPGSAQ